MTSEIMRRLAGELSQTYGYSPRGSRESARREERMDIEARLAGQKIQCIDGLVGVATTTEMKSQLLRKAAEMAAPDGGEAYAVYSMAGITAKAGVITDFGRSRQ